GMGGAGAVGDPALLGCSDGTREGFVDPTASELIAGCSGGWQTQWYPGFSTPAITPTCNHASGNSSANPGGAGCVMADLCAAGWHVCNNAAEVTAKSPTGCAGAVTDGSARFFSTLEVSYPGTDTCLSATVDPNGLVGCGTLGSAPTD